MSKVIDENGVFHLENVDVSKQELVIMRALYKHLDELYIEDDSIVKAHCDIKEHYMDKMNFYDESDVQIITEAFLSLGISEGECEIIKVILLKDVNKRKQNEKSSISLQNNKAVSQKKLLSKKDYRQLLEKLNNYFDINTGRVNRILSMSEIIECTTIMLELGFEQRDIKGYLMIMEQAQEKNPITWYINNIEKLEFYSEAKCYSTQLENLKEYFGEVFICNDEDYKFWKQSIHDELEQIVKLIPSTYQYELEKAKK